MAKLYPYRVSGLLNFVQIDVALDDRIVDFFVLVPRIFHILLALVPHIV